jgi:hypothetical protein
MPGVSECRIAGAWTACGHTTALHVRACQRVRGVETLYAVDVLSRLRILRIDMSRSHLLRALKQRHYQMSNSRTVVLRALSSAHPSQPRLRWLPSLQG